jgi:autotransporter-associated beta strand protein
MAMMPALSPAMKTPHSLLVFLALSASAFAGTVTWNLADANNNWNTTDLNWTGGVSFATGDDAVFNAATGETVLVDAGGVAPTSTTVASAGAWTFFGGPISGSLSKSGSGTLTLSSANSFSSVSVTGGNLSLGNTGALGANTVTFGTGTSTGTAATAMLATTALTTSSTIPNAITLPADTANSNRGLYMYGTGNGTNTLELSGKISGGTSFTTLYLNNNQSGAFNPQFILSNNTNDFRANILINRGGLRIASDSALGNAANTVTFNSNAGADLTFNNAMTYTRATTLSTGTDFNTNANAVTASGVISGAAGLTKIGTGSLTLSNANTYNGTTISNGPNSNTTGAIVIGNNAALGSGAVNINNTATITALFNGATSRTIANSIALSTTAGLTTNILAGNATAFELNGVVSGGTATSTLFINTNQGGGSTGFVKLGNTANTFLGRVQLNRGGLAIASDGSLGNAANPLTIDIGTISQIGLRFDSAISSGRNILLGASRQVLDTNANDVSLSGVISGTGDLFKASAGKLTLTGINTYTGTTTVNAGTLEIGAGGTTGNISAGAVVNNGVISFNRSNALTLAGNITGTGSLRQDGTGTTTLNGTFPATTPLTLNNGTFAFGTSSSAVTTGTVDSLTHNAGSLAIDVDGIASDVLTVTNAYNFTSGGIVLNILGAPNTGVPYPIVNYGTLTGTPTVTVNGLTGSRVAAAVDYGTGSASSVSVTFSGVVANLVWTGAANNTWDLATTNNWSNGGTPDSFHVLDNIVFDDSPTSGNTSPVLDFTATAGSIVFSNNTKTYTITGTGGLSGTTDMELNGGGTTIIATNNDYSGFTDVLGTSTLQIGDGGASGTLGTGGVYVEGALVFNRSNDFTVANSISGSGGLAKQGAGILTLTGANTYGTTTINGGTLRIGDGGTTGTTGTGDIINNGTFGINRSNAVTFTNSISGSGVLLKQGTGLLTLPNANTFGGGTQIQAGSILMTDPGALGAGAISHAGGQLRFSFGDGTTTIIPNAVSLNSTAHATFAVRGTADAAPALPTTVRLTGKISGGAAGQTYQLVDSAVTGNHNNVLELRNATNDFQGTIRMERGTLGIDSNAALGHPDNDIEHFTENLNGSLRFDADNIVLGSGRDVTMPGSANSRPVNTQAFTSTITGNISGTGVLVKQGTGTLILSGTNSASAATTVAAGTLQVDGTFNTSTAAVTVNTGATLGGIGTINRPVTVAGTIAPGNGTGTITVGNTLTLQPASAIDIDLTDWTGSAGTGFDTISATAVNVTATPVSKFQVRVDASSLVNFTDEEKSFVIATAAAAPTGLAADNWEVIPTGFSGAGEWTVETSGNDLVLVYSLGTPFSNWASSKGLTGLDAGFNADPDADGISNGLEFVLGGEPNPANPGSNSSALLPTFAVSGSNMIFTYSRADAAAYLNPVVEFNNLLSGTWTTAADPANATISVVDGSPSDTVTVTIPTLGSPTKFARLKVEEAP